MLRTSLRAQATLAAWITRKQGCGLLQGILRKVSELKWFQFSQKIINLRNKHRNDQLTRTDLAQERSISILQKRYGYSREKAASELDKYYSKARLG